MYFGGFIAIITSPFWRELLSPIATLSLGVLLLIPGGVDGTTQMVGERESTNMLRAITGFPLGIGVVLLLHGLVSLASGYIV